MELTKEEIQYLLNAVDAKIRVDGLANSATAVVVATKLQVYAKALNKSEGDNGAE